MSLLRYPSPQSAGGAGARSQIVQPPATIPAASRAAGFPVNITGTNTGTVNPQHLGDLMIVAGRRANNVVDVTAISGGGCTNWAKVVDRADGANFTYAFLWMGTVSTTGSQTLTLTVTDSVSSEITVDSFTSPTAGTWMADVSAANGAGASVPALPSLTPTKSGSTPIPELYYGWLFTNGTYTAGGTTPGYTYESIPFADGPLVWSTTVVSGAQQPTITVGSALWTTVAAIFYVGTSVPAAIAPTAASVSAAIALVTANAQLTPTAASVSAATTLATAPTSLGVPTAAASTAANVLVTANALLAPTAASVSAATAAVTAPALSAATSASVTAATAAITAPALLTATAASVTATTSPLYAPGPAPLGTPTAASISAATTLVTAPTGLAPTAASVTAATVLVTAPTRIGTPTAASISAATTLVTANALLTPASSSISAASASITAPALLAPTAASVSSAIATVTAIGSATLNPTSTSITAATAAITAASRLAPTAASITAASALITVATKIAPTAAAITAANATITAATPAIRQLGNGLIVTVAWNPRPTALNHARQVGALTVTGRDIQPLALFRFRAQGNPTLPTQPPGLAHTRGISIPTVNKPIIAPAGLARSTVGTLYPSGSLYPSPSLYPSYDPRALGIPTVIVPTPLPASLIHARALGTPTTSRPTIITVLAIPRTRALGNPRLSISAPNLTHARSLGSPSVNARNLAPLALSRA